MFSSQCDRRGSSPQSASNLPLWSLSFWKSISSGRKRSALDVPCHSCFSCVVRDNRSDLEGAHSMSTGPYEGVNRMSLKRRSDSSCCEFKAVAPVGLRSSRFTGRTVALMACPVAQITPVIYRKNPTRSLTSDVARKSASRCEKRLSGVS